MHRKEDWRRRLLLVAGCVLGLALTTAAPVPGQVVRPCDDDRCEVQVPLDRGGVVAGTLDLSVRVDTPSRVPNAGPDDGTLLVLLDGGEQTADLDSSLEFELMESLGPLVGRGRIVTLDRRGTGASDQIACGAPVRGSDRIAQTAACAAALGPARAVYATRDSVADIEAVRDSLGVERLTVYGIGEGARLGLAYASAHPEHVERLVLDSPVPPGGADPLRRSAFAAARGYVRALCQRTCPFTDDAAADFARLVRRTASTPLVATVIDGHGRPQSLAIGPADLAGLLFGRRGEYDSRFVPALVHAALHGDPAPLARLVSEADDAAAAAPLDAFSLVTACEDGPLPWPPGLGLLERRKALDAATAALPQSAFAPFGRRALAGLDTVDRCLGWPDPTRAPQPRPAPPRVPTLILAGRWDLQTPPADSVALARSIPGAQLLLHSDAGHGVLRFSAPSNLAGASSGRASVRWPPSTVTVASIGRPWPCGRSVASTVVVSPPSSFICASRWSRPSRRLVAVQVPRQISP